jgi:hypothetical protein
MKVGIITIQKCDNYGADLQAFALQRKLQLMGYEAENIDYLFYKHPEYKKTRKSRPSFKLSLVNRLKEWLFPKITKLKGLRNRSAVKARQKAFEDFFNENVKTSRRYNTIDDLYANPPKYDVYITGSDQVWNPRTGASIEPYFLTFAPDGAKKISYAASFGVASLPPSAYYKYSKWLESYSSISLREANGVRIARQFVGCVEPVAVCDPTLLLTAEEWKSAAHPVEGVKEGEYLLVYDLNVCSGLWELAHKWAKKLNLPIVRICRSAGCENIPDVVNMEAVGPGEFIWLVANAKAVVTTSFHGTAFSVIFNRPFYSVIPKGMSNSGRISNLLEKLDLSNRIIKEEECSSIEPILDIADYNAALGLFKAHSLDYLTSALG